MISPYAKQRQRADVAINGEGAALRYNASDDVTRLWRIASKKKKKERTGPLFAVVTKNMYSSAVKHAYLLTNL